MNDLMNRRAFVRRAATAGAGVLFASPLASLGRAATPPSANSRLRVAIAGTNSRGLAHVQCLAGVPNVEVAYVCDPDDRAIAKGMAAVAATKTQSNAPQGVRDFRRALDDRNVDAITIAAPDHWHAPMAILALAAGKHVFVEKPCSHNPRESELLVAAAEKAGRCVQMGNQRRSFPTMQEAITLIRGGAIGRPYFARGWYVNRRGSIGRGRPAAVPAWLDYELWRGPAPRRPFVDNLVHYNWHWFWHWGTGEALNNGTHEMDIARWALGVDFPTRVTSTGGRFQFDDDWETPDTQTIGWEFANGTAMSWEGRSCSAFPLDGRPRGTVIIGTEGSALLEGENCTLYDPKNAIVRELKVERQVDPTNTLSSTGLDSEVPHFRNFAEAIREGRPLNSPIADAHKAVTMLQLGNIAQRVGRTLQCDPATGRIQNDPEAMKLWSREYAPGWEPQV